MERCDENVKSLVKISLLTLSLHLLQQKPGFQLLLLGGLLALADVSAGYDGPFYYLIALFTLLTYLSPFGLLFGLCRHLRQLGIASNLAPLLVEHVPRLLDLLHAKFAYFKLC